MENRPLGPEEQDENTESTGTKKKRASKLSGYLSALRGKEAASASPEGENHEKPKRMQRLFARLFPGIVEKPAHLNPDTPEQQHEFNHDVWANITRFASRIEKGQQSVGEQQNDDEERTSNPTQIRSSVVAPTPANRDNTDSVPHVTPERTIDTASVSSDLASDIPTPSVNDREVSIDFGRQDHEPSTHPTPIERPATQETVIERRGGNLLPIALVGAEYIGRKRADKKLEARTDKKIDTLKKEQDHGSSLQKELEKVVSENKQQIEQLKKARATMESQAPERNRMPAEARTMGSERLETPKPEVLKTPELTSQQETADRVVPSQEAVQPNNIAEQVAEAAEHDVPVERAFERSHEVKDDDSHASSVVTGAASVGSVVATSVAAGMAATPKVVASGGKDLPFVSDEAVREFYKRAAARGFWSAICLIVLGTIAYLVVKY